MNTSVDSLRSQGFTSLGAVVWQDTLWTPLGRGPTGSWSDAFDLLKASVSPGDWVILSRHSSPTLLVADVLVWVSYCTPAVVLVVSPAWTSTDKPNLVSLERGKPFEKGDSVSWWIHRICPTTQWVPIALRMRVNTNQTSSVGMTFSNGLATHLPHAEAYLYAKEHKYVADPVVYTSATVMEQKDGSLTVQGLKRGQDRACWVSAYRSQSPLDIGPLNVLAGAKVSKDLQRMRKTDVDTFYTKLFGGLFVDRVGVGGGGVSTVPLQLPVLATNQVRAVSLYLHCTKGSETLETKFTYELAKVYRDNRRGSAAECLRDFAHRVMTAFHADTKNVFHCVVVDHLAREAIVCSSAQYATGVHSPLVEETDAANAFVTNNKMYGFPFSVGAGVVVYGIDQQKVESLPNHCASWRKAYKFLLSLAKTKEAIPACAQCVLFF